MLQVCLVRQISTFIVQQEVNVIMKRRIFKPTANFKINLYFVCLPACLPASQPAVRPSCARCRAPEISHDKGNGGRFYFEDDLPTAPWQFLLSFILLPYSSLFL